MSDERTENANALLGGMGERLKLGYTCPIEACETRVLLEEALLRLVFHDLAADKREGLPFHCIELQRAVDVLLKHCGYTDAMWTTLV